MLQLIERGGLFGGVMPPDLEQPWSLETKQMAKMHEDTSLLLADVAASLNTLLGLGSWQTTYFERLQVDPASCKYGSLDQW